MQGEMIFVLVCRDSSFNLFLTKLLSRLLRLSLDKRIKCYKILNVYSKYIKLFTFFLQTLLVAQL